MTHEMHETADRLAAIVRDEKATDRKRVDAFLLLNPKKRIASQVANGVGIPHEAVMEVFQARRAEQIREEAHKRGERA